MTQLHQLARTSPLPTLQVLVTAPTPVVMPQPSKHTDSEGACLGILATEISGNTVNSENVEVPM